MRADEADVFATGLVRACRTIIQRTVWSTIFGVLVTQLAIVLVLNWWNQQ